MSAIAPAHVEGGPFRQVRAARFRLPSNRRNGTIMPHTPKIRIPGQRQPEPQHQPWCAEHTDTTCYSADTVVGDLKVRLMWAPGEQVVADVATRSEVELFTLDELEQRALAMLTTALIGRGLTPSPSVLAAVTS